MCQVFSHSDLDCSLLSSGGMSPATRNHLLPDAIYISSLRVASARILIQLSDSMAGSDQAEVAAAAPLATPLKKKGSALDLACGNSSPATSQLGAGMSLESLVQKAMRDNLKGWSETELNGNRNSSGQAVDVGLINSIFCENDLVRARPAGLHEGRLQESVYCRWESARDSINEWLEASSSQEGATVVSLLTKKEAGMRAIDATFRLEVQFFSQLVGDAGERILQQQVKGCFPTLAKAVTEEQCLASLKVIQSGQLFKFVGAAAQGAVTNASTLVQHLSEGRQPNFAKNASEFLTEVKLGLGFFCRVEADVGTLVGEEAARYACDAVLEQNDTKPEQLEVPIKFCWLLDEDRFKRIEALRARIFQETTTTLVSAMKHGTGSTSCNKRAACPASSSASSSGPRKRASCTDSQLAMQMFRGVP